MRQFSSPSSRCASTATAAVTVFLCANCAGRTRPEIPDFGWPWPVKQVLLPCTGRLQPEHVLKAFEAGAELVCAVACEEDNCHYLEGSKRCARRVDYLRSILREIGLGGERLMLFHLPGTAAVREQVMRALEDLPPQPLGRKQP